MKPCLRGHGAAPAVCCCGAENPGAGDTRGAEDSHTRSDALRINAGIALLAAVVAVATITAATGAPQPQPTDAMLAVGAAEPVPAAP